MQLACLILVLVAATQAADPDAPRRGVKNLHDAVDCNGVVVFSATVTPKSSGGKAKNHQVVTFDTNLVDKSVGFSRESGIFTTHCPGLYQFSFTGSCDDCRLSIRNRPSSSTSSWNSVVTTGRAGGSHVVFMEMQVGEQAAVFLDSGTLATSLSHSFSGYRVSKK